ncbi:hypothetical protein [Gluconobacter albidus]|uniref:Uncharacterized protein n=1 Tax=Gluconobacter albidus TaxID=318683 RepID=A0AAW3QTM3_9PROT|nr:hypothetical protein [Gluconobacter albidus]KXV36954.1 hypothetical protein AD941_12825 [Gluconobacter albidus]MBS1027015.1 hypothetical protein [Gluconobacter albidus]MCP1274307.1 hypothetical protein [Gluconobacter albidus]GLQ69795.1 hypothetical protein GCM10007866_22480 [Gluconobacter albidus]
MVAQSNISAIRKAYTLLSENGGKVNNYGMTNNEWFDFLVDLNISALGLERLTKQLETMSGSVANSRPH